jgi:hypothetical protein
MPRSDTDCLPGTWKGRGNVDNNTNQSESSAAVDDQGSPVCQDRLSLLIGEKRESIELLARCRVFTVY